MARQVILAGTGWLATTAVTVALATAALGSIGAGILGPSASPLTPAEVARELAAAPPASARQSPSGEPGAQSSQPGTSGPAQASQARSTIPRAASPARGTTRVLTTDGGIVTARCVDGLVELISWSPAPGYRTDEVDRGPGQSASVSFEAGETEIKILVTCVNGQPRATRKTDD